MCRTNAVTKDDIELMKVTLLKRLDNPYLTPDQRAMLQAQYDYVVSSVKELKGSGPVILSPQ